MSFYQKEITVKTYSRGFHIITNDILENIPDINQIEIGLLHIFLKHTSASIAINESADPTVLSDMESHFNKFIPEKAPYYTYRFEGSDDMPAHIKSVTIGANLTIPITQGKLNLGAWQGIYLCEHRNNSPTRDIVLTISY